jgi:hypothetical protein
MTTAPAIFAFHIDAYSPATIPMAKLAAYMADFAALLGLEHRVHFDRLEAGSTAIVSHVAREDAPKVRTRLSEISRGDMTRLMGQIVRQIDDRLANDNAVGRILVSDGPEEAREEILTFAGRTRTAPQVYGPFNQDGHLDGLLISVGGKDETISLRLQTGEIVYANCETTRAVAREIARHLFEPVRVYGTGRWARGADGTWALLRFRVQRFSPLEAGSLSDAVAALRAIRDSGWNEMGDPLGELGALRGDTDELH